MTLGSAIPPPPSTQLASVAENALESWLRERSDTLFVIQEILRAQEQTQMALANIVQSFQSTQATVAETLVEAARSLSSAASGLAARVEQPAPVVNVTIPEIEPVVNVQVEAAPVHVQMMEAEESEKPEKKSREITTVERDAEGRIVRTITEEVE